MQSKAEIEFNRYNLRKILDAIAILVAAGNPLSDEDKRLICSIKVKHGLM